MAGTQGTPLSPLLPLEIQAEGFSWPSYQVMVPHSKSLKAPALLVLPCRLTSVLRRPEVPALHPALVGWAGVQ